MDLLWSDMSSNKGSVLLRSSFAFPSALATVLHKLFSSLTHTETHTYWGVCVGRQKGEESLISQWPGGGHRERNGSYVGHSQHCVVSPNKAFPSPACQRHHCGVRKEPLYHTHIPHMPPTPSCAHARTHTRTTTRLNKQKLLNLHLLCTNLDTDTLSFTVDGVVLAPSSLYFTGQKRAAERPALSACDTQWVTCEWEGKRGEAPHFSGSRGS